jgi:hypothetical protein
MATDYLTSTAAQGRRKWRVGMKWQCRRVSERKDEGGLDSTRQPHGMRRYVSW